LICAEICEMFGGNYDTSAISKYYWLWYRTYSQWKVIFIYIV